MIGVHEHHEYPADAFAEPRLWTAPLTWVAGELVSASLFNTHIRDNLLAIGKWSPGDMKITYATHANATSTTLTEAQVGWYIANGATFVQATHPTLYANIGNTTTLPDYRGRMFVAPGTQDGHAFARGETGGEYDHALTSGELAAHAHGSTALTVTGAPSITDPGHIHNGTLRNQASSDGLTATNETLQLVVGSVDSATTGITAGLGTLNVGGSTDSAGSGTAHATMSPYRVGGMFVIKHDN